MKTLYLVRHAKASWEDNVSDWQRPLLQEGVERAGKIAGILHAKKVKPDLIITSHAFRALNTAIIFSLGLGYPVKKIFISESVYAKKPSEILNMLAKQEDIYDSIMLFGHNPAIADMYNTLTNNLLISFSTSATACIEFAGDKWADIQKAKGKSRFLETGK